MTGTIRLGLLFALTLLLSGCALVSVTSCAQWDLTHFFGLDLGLTPCHPKTIIGTSIVRPR
jgi:hypothetical protein